MSLMSGGSAFQACGPAMEKVIPPVHIMSNHVDTAKLTTANGGTFTSSSASLSSQSR